MSMTPEAARAQMEVDYPPFAGRVRHVGQDAYLPLQVTLADLEAEHEAGWVNFHPEDFCHRCGNRNVSWAADGDVWSSVMGSGEGDPWHGIICIPCFTELYERRHGQASWSIAYDENGNARVSPVSEPPTTDDRGAIALAVARQTRSSRGVELFDIADAILAAGFRRPSPPTAEPEWEYGWRAFFDNGEEYEWLACSSLEEARFQAAEYQKQEEHVSDGGHLAYSVWKRQVAKAGPWAPVDAAARVGGAA